MAELGLELKSGFKALLLNQQCIINTYELHHYPSLCHHNHGRELMGRPGRERTSASLVCWRGTEQCGVRITIIQKVVESGRCFPKRICSSSSLVRKLGEG